MLQDFASIQDYYIGGYSKSAIPAKEILNS